MITKVYKFVSPRRIEEFYETIETNNVVVKLEVAAICKADLRYYLGKREERLLLQKYPINPLHEAVGQVVKDSSGTFKVGDKVILIPNSIDQGKCQTCPNWRCKEKELGENYCPDAIFASSNSDGFLREIASIDSANLLKYDHIQPTVAVFAELMSIASSLTRRARITSKDVLAVWGDGLLGYLLYIYLKTNYQNRLIVVGTNEHKLALFEKAEKFLVSENKKIAEMGISVAFECVGGQASEKAINQIIDVITVGGEIILGGVSENPVGLNTRKVLEKGINLKGVTRSAKQDFVSALKVIEKNPIEIEKLALSTTTINSINVIYDIFEKEAENTQLGKNLLVFPK